MRMRQVKTEWERRPVDFLFKEGYELKKQGKCPTCGNPINPKEFRDQLSWAEYLIAGMCQSCQDKVFTDVKEEHDSHADLRM
jgi:uncharacterized CHY-type Zn-finger protein